MTRFSDDDLEKMLREPDIILVPFRCVAKPGSDCTAASAPSMQSPAKGRDGDRKRTERFCLGDCLRRYGRAEDEVKHY